jgi:hypothetical protein
MPADNPRELISKGLGIYESLMRRGYKERRRWLWHHVQPRMPRFLYKFRGLDPNDLTSVDRMKDFIVRSRLWLSSPFDFNDPFDMQAKVVIDGTILQQRRRFDEILKRRRLKSTERRKEIKRIFSETHEERTTYARNALQETINEFGVYSFGGDPRNILMWSHYGSNHKGVCLQFEFARDLLTFFSLIEMVYTKEYHTVKWTTEVEKGLQATLQSKHEGWKYEEETRLVIMKSSHKYIEFRPAALRSIIIGCRADSKTVQTLRSLLKERSAAGHPSVTLYRAYQHDSKYELVIKKG